MNAVAPGFRKTLGYGMLGIVAIYLILGLWITIVPGARLFNHKLTHLYRWVALPGPFFNDERILAPRHFWVSYKTKQGSWTPYRNPEAELLKAYRDSFFDYNSLQYSRTTNFMAQMLHKAWMRKPGAIQATGALRNMHAHLRHGYIPADADSVRMRYDRGVLVGDVARREVLFNFTYPSF